MSTNDDDNKNGSNNKNNTNHEDIKNGNTKKTIIFALLYQEQHYIILFDVDTCLVVPIAASDE